MAQVIGFHPSAVGPFKEETAACEISIITE